MAFMTIPRRLGALSLVVATLSSCVGVPAQVSPPDTALPSPETTSIPATLVATSTTEAIPLLTPTDLSTPTVPAPTPTRAGLDATAPLHYLEQHRLGSGSVRAVSLSSDGHSVAVATESGLQIRSLPDLTLQQSFSTEASFEAVSWSPDGSFIAAGGSGAELTLWQSSNVTEPAIRLKVEGAIRHLAWSSDGGTLAVVTIDTTYLWNVSTQQLERRDDLASVSLAWSPDGQSLVLGFGKERAVDIHAGTSPDAPVAQLFGVIGPVWSLAWSPDGRQVVAGGGELSPVDGRNGYAMDVWNLADRSNPIVSVPFAAPVNRVDWSSDGTLIAVGLEHGEVDVRSPSGELMSRLESVGSPVRDLAWLGETTRLLVGTQDGVLRVWDAASGAILADANPSNAIVPVAETLEWSPDGQALLIACQDGSVQVWDTGNWTRIASTSAHPGGALEAVWSPDGARYASSGEDGSINIWDANTHAIVETLERSEIRVAALAWLPGDPATLAVGRHDDFQVWDVKALALLSMKDTSAVRHLAWSPDRQWLAIAPSADSVKILQVPDYTNYKINMSVGRTMDGLAWSPDSQRLLMGGGYGDVSMMYVWDVVSEDSPKRLTGPNAAISAAAWAPNGLWWAVGTSDGRIEIWDATMLTKITSLSNHTDAINDLAWSPDARWLASSSEDGTIRIWGAP